MSIDYILIGSNELARCQFYLDMVMPHVGGNKMRIFPGATLAQGDSV